MANEIEMNFKIIDKNSLLNYLRSLADEKTQNIKMTYLGKHGDDSFYTRIEEISDENGDKKVLTAKGNFVSTDGVNQRKEVSIPINETPEKYIEFLTLIGMELRDSKSKVRHFFHVDDLDITIDEWNVTELGDRLEIEGSDEAKVKEFAAKIVQFCEPTPSK
ncbi:MAG TPA: hypothetical protein PK639_04190 [Candidatus Woesebacteria bacterium]|nr:hypothetical protein [Candidatus Woesebacteria bacterium]